MDVRVSQLIESINSEIKRLNRRILSGQYRLESQYRADIAICQSLERIMKGHDATKSN